MVDLGRIELSIRQPAPLENHSVDYLLHNWNYLIKELQEWQSLGMAIEEARTA